MNSKFKIDAFRTQLNRLGSAGIPFLFLIDFEMEKPVVFALQDLPHGILYNFNGNKNYLNGYSFEPTLDFDIEPISFETFKKAFSLVLDEINYGNSFLLNLAFKSRIHTELSLQEIFFRSKAKYKFIWPDEFVFFSPESFVRLQDGQISSFPMKGTIDASIPGAKQKILENQKELAEHYTIVDLIRNDLSMVAKNVRVSRFRYLDHIQTNHKNLYQVSSEIIGKLPDNYLSHLGDIMLKLLPAGSITGAPKKKTVEIIQEAEAEDRGYYTGICGVFDGEVLDTGVMIRFIEKQNNQLFYRSGSGITFQSKLEEEYQELIDKVYVPAT